MWLDGAYVTFRSQHAIVRINSLVDNGYLTVNAISRVRVMQPSPVEVRRLSKFITRPSLLDLSKMRNGNTVQDISDVGLTQHQEPS